MRRSSPNVAPEPDTYALEVWHERFLRHIADAAQPGYRGEDDERNPYSLPDESYKTEVRRAARLALNAESWTMADVGHGTIAAAVVRAFNVEHNNLVELNDKWGPGSAQTARLFSACAEPGSGRDTVEDLCWRLYRESGEPGEVFDGLVAQIGGHYSVPAYLFFLADDRLYMPIAPDHFDAAFARLGISTRTSHRCRWSNYTEYLGVLASIRSFLRTRSSRNVSLLDAHSFAWVVSDLGEADGEAGRITTFGSLPQKDKEAVIRARVGQGRFRTAVIARWGSCAVTGLTEPQFLTASHIKPWCLCDVREATDPSNGLLLAPNIDAAFDKGVISFRDDGTIIVSSDLDADAAAALGISGDMRLSSVDAGSLVYLDHHRRTNGFAST